MYATPQDSVGYVSKEPRSTTLAHKIKKPQV